jgi:hypothetical protein
MLAKELGLDPATARAWLRRKRAAGDRRLSAHELGRPWQLEAGLAWDLAREFEAEKLGEPVEDVRGPHAWRNWRAFTAGRPRRSSSKTSTSLILSSWEEYALYSDAGIRGELMLGPYRFINTIARESDRVGSAELRIVLRADEHLGEPDYSSPIEEEDVTSSFAGGLDDELAALLSLALSRRMRSGGVTRRAYADGDEAGTPAELEYRPPVLIPPRGTAMLPHLAEAVHLEAAQPHLEHYRDLAEDDAIALARAASQFADALWLADADPRLAWIKLVGAVEAAANRWESAKARGPVELLRRNRKRVYNAIKDCGEYVVERVARDLAGTFKATDKFKDFVLEFDPGPPAVRPEVGRFDWSELETALVWIYGSGELVERYKRFVIDNPGRTVFAGQALYSLMRIILEEAYEAPITQDLTDLERRDLTSALLASNSVTARGIDMSVGELREDLLAYELQIGHYYHRGRWMEDIVRHRELYLRATTDERLLASPDAVPVSEWLERSGLNADQQFELGFALGAVSNAWDSGKHPHVAAAGVAGTLEQLGLADRSGAAWDVISTDRAGYVQDFAELAASGKRFTWELRPFNVRPFLRTADGGLLLIGRPWLWSWLSEGFYYRPMRVAQAEDAAGRRRNVQRYTAYTGQTFERYCLDLAEQTFTSPTQVWGEQPYAKGGSKTSDVAVLVGNELVLFEANARRVGVEPLVGGDPLDATGELARLIVKKINQLGVCITALLDGRAVLPGLDIANVKRIWPVVVAGGHVWQTQTLWNYLDATRDNAKCASLDDERVGPLQLLDPDDYEMLLALIQHGSDLPWMLARKTDGVWRHRDLAVWLNQDSSAPDHRVRLASTLATWEAMIRPIDVKLRAASD